VEVRETADKSLRFAMYIITDGWGNYRQCIEATAGSPVKVPHDGDMRFNVSFKGQEGLWGGPSNWRPDR
jgi:hypothetical protein